MKGTRSEEDDQSVMSRVGPFHRRSANAAVWLILRSGGKVLSPSQDSLVKHGSSTRCVNLRQACFPDEDHVSIEHFSGSST